mmetsp:Transcript_18102/g.59457  ORF Transcript_18102/g.59457 Transcript_18102/m.59457 type:complete len:258 (-) Transcript_18102:2088-2861(-)
MNRNESVVIPMKLLRMLLPLFLHPNIVERLDLRDLRRGRSRNPFFDHFDLLQRRVREVNQFLQLIQGLHQLHEARKDLVVLFQAIGTRHPRRPVDSDPVSHIQPHLPPPRRSLPHVHHVNQVLDRHPIHVVHDPHRQEVLVLPRELGAAVEEVASFNTPLHQLLDAVNLPVLRILPQLVQVLQHGESSTVDERVGVVRLAGLQRLQQVPSYFRHRQRLLLLGPVLAEVQDVLGREELEDHLEVHPLHLPVLRRPPQP